MNNDAVKPPMAHEHYNPFLDRVATKFDTDPTCAEFTREDGEGGFVGAIHRMAREIDRLRAINAPTPREQELMAALDEVEARIKAVAIAIESAWGDDPPMPCTIEAKQDCRKALAAIQKAKGV